MTASEKASLRAKDLTQQLLTFAKGGDYVKINIKDHGVGIPATILDKVFDPYFTTKEKGSGLGLAITHSIVSKHGGHITINSVPGQGCMTTIYLAATREKQTTAPVKAPATPI